MLLEPDTLLIERLVSTLPDACEFMKKRDNRDVCGDQDVFIYNFQDWSERKELSFPEEYNEVFYSLELLAKKLNTFLQFFIKWRWIQHYLYTNLIRFVNIYEAPIYTIPLR